MARNSSNDLLGPVTPFEGNQAKLVVNLTQFWDINTLQWVKGTQPIIDGGELNVTIAPNQTVKATIQGTTDAGNIQPVSVTTEGHVEVAIHSPTLPFGSVHTENLAVVFQADAVYGLNPSQVQTTVGNAAGGASSATVTGTSNLFKCLTGTTAYSFSTIQSRKRLRYRPGQGVVGRFAGYFISPTANKILVAGFGTAEAGFYFGYNGTSYGILYVTGGVRAIRTLTVTTASTATNNYNVVLNGATAVNVTATNNASTVKTAYEISKGTYPGWTAQAIGSTVVFLASDAGPKNGVYSLAQSGAATPAAGTFANTLTGVASTDTWIPQASWNGDPLDGNGPSGYTINPLTGNVYQIGIQYLGFGSISFQVEVTSPDANNSTFVTVHTIKYQNTSTSTSVSQPSFPFTMAAYSAGSVVDGGVAVGSFAGFNEGQRILAGPRMSYERTSTAVTTGAYYALETIANALVFNGRANQSVVNLVSWGACHDDATPVTMYLIKNATLIGTPNFTAWSPQSSTLVDTAATTCTITDNSQILYQLPVGQGGSVLVNFNLTTDEISLQPGETLTLAAQTVTGTATYTLQNLNTREDQ